MPKAIKKKKVSVSAKEQDVKSIMSKAVGAAARQKKRLTLIIMAAVLAVIIPAGVYFYKSGIRKDAERLQYEGYRFYYGLYEKQPLTKTDSLKKALDSFNKAYALRPTPFSLYYIANAQYALGNYADAIAALKEFNGRFPQDVLYGPLKENKLAMASLHAGDPDGALKAFDSIAEGAADSFKDLALAESARLLEAQGKTEEAKRRYEDLAKNFPDSPFAAEASAKLNEGKIEIAPSSKK